MVESQNSWMRRIARWLVPNGGTVLVLCLFLFWQRVSADTSMVVPSFGGNDTYNYQGFLTDSDGQVINGTLAMTFRLYDVASGGTALWTETRSGPNGVTVEDGIFTVQLGEVTPLPSALWETTPLYLGVQLAQGTELAPRESIGLVPIAAHALTVPNGSITSEKFNPTLEQVYFPEPNFVYLNGTPQTLISTTVTIDTPSQLWLFITVDGEVRGGTLIGWAVIDGVVQDRQVRIGRYNANAGEDIFLVSSNNLVVNLEPGIHDIELQSFLLQGQGTGRIFTSHTNISYMLVSQ